MTTQPTVAPHSKTILGQFGRFVTQADFDLGSEPFSLGKASLIAQLGLSENASMLVNQPSINMVRHALIDTIGNTLIGSKLPIAVKTQTATSGWGTGASAVLGTDLLLPAPWAALANCTAGNLLQVNDWEAQGHNPTSTIIFSALLATAAENEGAVIGGRAIFDAFLAGFEVVARIGKAVHANTHQNGQHSTAPIETLGAVGAAAAVSRLNRLTAEQATHAMSIAINQAVSSTDQGDTNNKALQAGLAAKTGVVAATLAANGLTGQPNILEANNRFTQLLGIRQVDQHSPVLAKLGSSLAINDASRDIMTLTQVLARFTNNTGLAADSRQVLALQQWIEAADIVEVINQFTYQS